MYKIERTDWGLHLTFKGSIGGTEMSQWLEASRIELAGVEAPFYVFVDMRSLIPIDREAQVYILEGQKFYREKGMERSVVILSSPVVAAQFRRLGGETGIGRWERYIDSTGVPNWEEVGMDWLLNASDPDDAKAEIKTGPLAVGK